MGVSWQAHSGRQERQAGVGLERSTKHLSWQHHGMSACMLRRGATCVQCKHHSRVEHDGHGGKNPLHSSHVSKSSRFCMQPVRHYYYYYYYYYYYTALTKQQ